MYDSSLYEMNITHVRQLWYEQVNTSWQLQREVKHLITLFSIDNKLELLEKLVAHRCVPSFHYELRSGRA